MSTGRHPYLRIKLKEAVMRHPLIGGEMSPPLWLTPPHLVYSTKYPASAIGTVGKDSRIGAI